MAASYTTTALLASVKRRSFLPANDETYTDEGILELFNEELNSFILPFIRECNEELLIRRYDVVPPSDGRMRIGTHFALESVKAVYATKDNVHYHPITRVEPEEALAQESAWYFEDDYVCLCKAPSNYTGIRFTYYLRPSQLVPVDECAQVTGLGAPGVVLLSGTPTAIEIANVDFVAGSPGLRILAMDVEQTNNIGSSTEIAPEIAALLSPGDFMCAVGTSCVPNIPADLVPVLVQRVACVMLAGKNDVALAQHEARLQQMLGAARSGYNVRSQGSPRYVRGPLGYFTGRRWPFRNWWFGPL